MSSLERLGWNAFFEQQLPQLGNDVRRAASLGARRRGTARAVSHRRRCRRLGRGQRTLPARGQGRRRFSRGRRLGGSQAFRGSRGDHPSPPGAAEHDLARRRRPRRGRASHRGQRRHHFPGHGADAGPQRAPSRTLSDDGLGCRGGAGGGAQQGRSRATIPRASARRFGCGFPTSMWCGSARSETRSSTALSPYLQPAKTVALLGMSGVGKSMLDQPSRSAATEARDLQRVGAVRESDGRGRHTTTSRQLVELAGGALLIDTPGMRELQLWSGRVGGRTGVRRHRRPRGPVPIRRLRARRRARCAVLEAIAAGRLDDDRLANYNRLLREAAFEARKRDKAGAADVKRQWKQITKAARARYKERDRE